MSYNLPQKYHALEWWERRDVRNQYVEEQNGACCHCGAPLSGHPSDILASKKLNMRLFPRNFLKHPVHLHHCHDTGLTIGAVHAHCNGVLWQYHGE